MTTRVVRSWVDIASFSQNGSSSARWKSVALALAERAVHFVPVTLSEDGASFRSLTAEESAPFGQNDLPDTHGGDDSSSEWFLSFPQCSSMPPFPKTLAKIAKAEGWRVAEIEPDERACSTTSEAARCDLLLASLPRGGDPHGDDWSKWATESVEAMARAERQSRPKVPLPSTRDRPLLSICVTTYNRASWLAHSLPLILEQTAPYAEIVEVVVCDNASQDETPAVAEGLRHHPHFAYHRNEKNVGMLGNLGVSCDHARGRYIWVIGDDDLMVEGTVERVLAAIVVHPSVELIYTNYAYTRFDRPQDLVESGSLIRRAKAISHQVRDEFATRVSSIATKSENCFTAIYSLIYREDHARRAYHQDVSGRPFSSLLTSVPSAAYICRELLDRPGYWIGDPCVVVNMNVSWMRYASLYVLERFPELFDLMQENGVDAGEMDALRSRHVRILPGWFRQIYLGSHREHLPLFSAERLVRRFRHLPAFRSSWPSLRKVYEKAFAGPGTEDPLLTPERLDAMVADGTRSIAV